MKTAATFLLLVLLLSSLAAFSQRKETFDLASYVPPSGWEKVTHTASGISYAITNNQRNTYCQMMIYSSTISKGSLQADFENEWKELIVNTYKTTRRPELVPTASENGWDAQGGAAPFEFNGGQSVAMLITMSGHGKCMSIVVLTNTEDYQRQVENFLTSVELQKPDTDPVPVIAVKDNSSPGHDKPGKVITNSTANIGYHFSTTNFDDGWTSTIHDDWVQVAKGNISVLVHFPNKNADAYNSVVLDGLKNAWNILVSPRYSSASNFEFKPIRGWQTIEFAEADAIEKATGRNVHVVLFKMNYSNGSGKYLEFITPDKATFEKEFGPYHDTSYGWEKMESMTNYNKFGIAATDLRGTWTNDFTGALQYVNAYTGADAGMASHASNEKFAFGPGNTYNWDIGVASGMVGNIKFQSAKSNGTFSVPNNWQINFSDLEGKPRTYKAHFSCVKGARILWLGETGYGRID